MSGLLIVVLLSLIGGMRWEVALAAGQSHSQPFSFSLAGQGSGDRLQEETRSSTGGLTAELLAKAIQAYLEEKWGERVKEVQVAVLEPSDSITVPPGRVAWRVVPSHQEERMGRRSFQVMVTVNGKRWKAIEVVADVTAMIDVVAPNRFIKPDEVIDASDLKMIRVSVTQVSHPFLINKDEVIGKSATRPLPADTPLRAVFLKEPVVIRKGDRVVIEVKRGGLFIQAYGVTKSSGHVGQTIMVANSDSGRELRAKVVGPGLVQVDF